MVLKPHLGMQPVGVRVSTVAARCLIIRLPQTDGTKPVSALKKSPSLNQGMGDIKGIVEGMRNAS